MLWYVEPAGVYGKSVAGVEEKHFCAAADACQDMRCRKLRRSIM
jgi:hypothetical protein